MEIKARAKLNWTLDITGTRADGYHLLDMLVQSLELCDTLSFAKSDSLSLEIVGNETLKAEPDNLILRAARALEPYASEKKGAHITLTKRIPTQAGLGGGSADAAATLTALNQLWELQLSQKTLQEIGLSLGADVPYCLSGGAKRVRGIGEKLSSITIDRTYSLVLVKPCAGLSTKEVFARADNAPPLHPDTAGALDALALGNLALLRKTAGNSLLPAAVSMRSELADALDALKQVQAEYASMTGSGAVVFGVFSSEALANAAADTLRVRYPEVIVTKTLTDSM